jgi:hypothetical protein
MTTTSERCARKRLTTVRLAKSVAGRTCATTGKLKYDTEDQANAEIQKCQKKRGIKSIHVEKRHYLCPSCMHLHLTSH